MSTTTRTAGDLKPGDIIELPAGEGIVIRVESVYLGPTISYDAEGKVIPIGADFMPRRFDPAWRVLHIQTKYGPDPGVPYFLARFPHEVV